LPTRPKSALRLPAAAIGGAVSEGLSRGPTHSPLARKLTSEPLASVPASEALARELPPTHARPGRKIRPTCMRVIDDLGDDVPVSEEERRLLAASLLDLLADI
jgi:hypothetical protein